MNDLWEDDERVSEAMQDLKCLEFRGRREAKRSDGSVFHVYPPVKSGKPAIAALRFVVFAEFGCLVHAEVCAVIREKAEDEINQELDV